MIRLTKLDGGDMYLNPDQIEIIEETPDTHITLLNGNRYLVREKIRIIIDRIITFKGRVIHRADSCRWHSHLKRQTRNDRVTGCPPDRDE